MAIRDSIYAAAINNSSGGGGGGSYPTIIMDVIKLAYDAEPFVEKSGTAAAPVFMIGLPFGGEPNKIEAIQVGKTILEIVDKTVTIPITSGTILGLVMASREIGVTESGELFLKEVGVSKLVNDDVDLIWDCGSSVN